MMKLMMIVAFLILAMAPFLVMRQLDVKECMARGHTYDTCAVNLR
jgi:hypothetical protein